MGDEHERLASLDEQPHHVEQPIDLVGRERRGRLVEDDDLGVGRQRLQDLDHLTLACRECAHGRPQGQAAALSELVEQRRGALGEVLPSKPAGRAELGQVNILENAQIRRETRLLHHHRDAGADRLARGDEAHGSAEQPDLAPVGRQVAGDNARERGFSGAVGADQGMDLPGAEHEARAGERLGALERLPDIVRIEREIRAVLACRNHRHETPDAMRAKVLPNAFLAAMGPPAVSVAPCSGGFYLPFRLMRGSQRRAQPSPARVPAAGRYSQPIQPS